MKDIIELAKECGVHEYGPLTRNWSFELSQLERFAALVRAEVLAEPVKQEPVEFQMICPRCLVDRVTTPCPNRGGANDCPMTGIAQRTAPVDAKTIRAEALEEAADVADSMNPLQDGAIGEAIRRLK